MSGVQIKAGDTATLMIGAANVDEASSTTPDDVALRS